MKRDPALYRKFLGCLTKKGNKVSARKSLESSFLTISQKIINRNIKLKSSKQLNKNKKLIVSKKIKRSIKQKRRKVIFFRLLKSISLKMGNNVEIRTSKMRKSVRITPIPIKSHRANYLIVKKIMESIKEDTTKRPLSEKLGDEFIGIVLNDKYNKSLQKNKMVLKQTKANKVNIQVNRKR